MFTLDYKTYTAASPHIVKQRGLYLSNQSALNVHLFDSSLNLPVNSGATYQTMGSVQAPLGTSVGMGVSFRTSGWLLLLWFGFF